MFTTTYNLTVLDKYSFVKRKLLSLEESYCLGGTNEKKVSTKHYLKIQQKRKKMLTTSIHQMVMRFARRVQLLTATDGSRDLPVCTITSTRDPPSSQLASSFIIRAFTLIKLSYINDGCFNPLGFKVVNNINIVDKITSSVFHI